MLMLIMLGLYIGLLICTLLYLRKLGKSKQAMSLRKKSITTNKQSKSKRNVKTDD